MKETIQRWLGIKNLQQEIINLRIRCAMIETDVKKCEDGGSMFNGESAKEDSLKEFVYGMAKYLKLRPHKSYKEAPVEPVETKTLRIYEVIKVK